MSNPAEFSDGRRAGKSPEKSNFAQTCNRLSQYLKERGNLRNLGLEMAGKLEPKATKNLLPNMENPGETATQHGHMDLLKDSPENTNKAASGRKPVTIDLEPETAQMTIFYGGKVLVFDSVPAEKATELMALAGGGESRVNSSESRQAAGPNPGPEQAQPQPNKAIGSGVPIARRASLHRFMEKRKDRVTARAPYQVQGGPSTSRSKDDEELALKL
ncbi:jasmonate ZIM domain-containing protein 1-like [Diospyros lotus]|uniref:jasmonate ZIM domain-containing protein 1-like n=1 Tax=Diospyros lotus TaxID=55363 RepID=UPI00225ADD8E|nr:jasmonate ZIM domain-containing protein 1-like [Diospyros lotus]